MEIEILKRASAYFAREVLPRIGADRRIVENTAEDRLSVASSSATAGRWSW